VSATVFALNFQPKTCKLSVASVKRLVFVVERKKALLGIQVIRNLPVEGLLAVYLLMNYQTSDLLPSPLLGESTLALTVGLYYSNPKLRHGAVRTERKCWNPFLPYQPASSLSLTPVQRLLPHIPVCLIPNRTVATLCLSVRIIYNC
jgi:hypothetical protein